MLNRDYHLSCSTSSWTYQEQLDKNPYIKLALRSISWVFSLASQFCIFITHARSKKLFIFWCCFCLRENTALSTNIPSSLLTTYQRLSSRPEKLKCQMHLGFPVTDSSCALTFKPLQILSKASRSIHSKQKPNYWKSLIPMLLLIYQHFFEAYLKWQ